MNDKLVIGVLGGMGTYATIHLFKQYAEVFPGEKEWDRPRIIIDNRCTMPSRVRAFLYNEKVDQLVEEITDSLIYLKNAGCNRILLACNTSHLFLPAVFKKAPELERLVVNIVDACVSNIITDKVKKVFLLASEGTIESKIYQTLLFRNNVVCEAPCEDEYAALRICIEAVKQNKYTEEVRETFVDLFDRCDTYILGCTELPILFERYGDLIKGRKTYDPVLIGLNRIRNGAF